MSRIVWNSVLLAATISCCYSHYIPFAYHGTGHHHDDEDEKVKIPGTTEQCFLLVGLAALAHGIGAAMPFVDQLLAMTNIKFRILNSPKFLSGALAFSAGVMIFGSLGIIYGEAVEALEESVGPRAATYAFLFFFGGVIGILGVDILVDKLDAHNVIHNHDIPELQPNSPEHIREDSLNDFKVDAQEKPTECKKKLFKVGFQTLLAMFIHNIPEGIVTFTTAKHDFRLGAMIGFAIIFHNIPEGLAAVTPLYYATGSQWKAFLLAGGGSIATPIGGLIAWVFMKDSLDSFTAGAIEAFTAGIMTFISFHGLIPSARAFDPQDRISTISLFIGMAVMALGLGLIGISDA
jgi:ZIP family zinc transporter